MKRIGTIAEKGVDSLFTVTPTDGGKALVTLSKEIRSGQKRTMEVEVTRAEFEEEALKMGLGPPTAHTPVSTDRVTG